MRTVLFLVTILATSFAFAWPNVGDSRRTRTSFFGVSLTPFDTVDTITAVDFVNDLIDINTQIISENGTSSNYTAQSPYKETVSNINSVLSNCAGVGGVEEKLELPAGTFRTCKLTLDSENNKIEIWYAANVLFGYVKFRSSGGTPATGYESILVSATP